MLIGKMRSIRSLVTPLPVDVTQDKDLKSIMAECFLSTKMTSKVMFPERFYLPFSSLHDQIFEVLDNDDIQKVVIAAPRGFGKTSLINLAYPAKHILFRDKKFIVPISNSATSAILQADNLKRELVSNTLVQDFFGDIKSNQWSKDQWITSGETMIMPRGSGQQVRGLLHGNYRPDLIVVDDLEDPEAVQSEEQRRKLKEWFFADVCNSINRARKDWKIVVIGTILHEDSLLVNLLEDASWHSVKLSICEDDYTSNWEDFMSSADVVKLANTYRDAGMLDVFYREYRNMPISTEDASFKAEYFKYYEEVDLRKNKNIENVIILDPAKTVKVHSADSAIVGVGIDVQSNALYVRDIVAKMLHPDEIYDELFAMAVRLNVRVIGIEVTSLHEFITYPLKNEMVRRGLNFEIVELHARGGGGTEKGKANRIKALIPFYRQGLVFHNKNISASLEAQLLSFPRSKKWDIMDAFAYTVELLEKGLRYFYPHEEDEYDIEKEYEMLEDEDYEPPIKNWRSV